MNQVFGLWHLLLATSLLISAIAAWTDWRTGLIPNWLVFGGAGFGVLAHAVGGFRSAGVSGLGAGLLTALLGAVVAGLVPVLMFRQGAIAGGDVKLLIALGVLLGFRLGIDTELYAFVAAAIFSMGKMAYEGKLLRTLKNAVIIMTNPLLPEHRRKKLDEDARSLMRFAPAIFAGVLVTAILNIG